MLTQVSGANRTQQVTQPADHHGFLAAIACVAGLRPARARRVCGVVVVGTGATAADGGAAAEGESAPVFGADGAEEVSNPCTIDETSEVGAS